MARRGEDDASVWWAEEADSTWKVFAGIGLWLSKRLVCQLGTIFSDGPSTLTKDTLVRSYSSYFIALFKTSLYWEHSIQAMNILWAWDVENMIPKMSIGYGIGWGRSKSMWSCVRIEHWIWNHPIEIRLAMIVPPQEEASVCDQFDTEALS
jgi:hypothetical protein